MAATGHLSRQLDTTALRWQWALDAASSALDAGFATLPAAELSRRRQALVHERHDIAALLRQSAALVGVETEPWLPPGHVTPEMLGLHSPARACIFDLEGVLTDSGVFHALAWSEALDPLLLSLADETDRRFAPFDPDGDYRLCFDGRPRLDGIRVFLESRGLHLPEGAPSDPPSAATVHGVARRKGELLATRLAHRSVAALTDARRYLLAAGYAHLGRAVVSASMTALPMLEVADLSQLVDVRVDAETIRSEHLRPRPHPDVLLSACTALGVAAEQAVSLTHSGAGVVACREAGIPAIGIARGVQAERLRGFGAEQVVPSLSALLDRGLRVAA